MVFLGLLMAPIHVLLNSKSMTMGRLPKKLIQISLPGFNKIRMCYAGLMQLCLKVFFLMQLVFLLPGTSGTPWNEGSPLCQEPTSFNSKPSFSRSRKATRPYLNSFQESSSLSNSLAAVSCPVGDEDLIIHTLNGLPPDFGPFKTSILTLSSPITIKELHVLLLCE